MDKNKAIELLKQAIDEVPKLKKLHYNNQDYKLWVFNIENIIKAGLDADDYERLDFVQSKYFPDELVIDNLSLEEDYLPKLNDYEVALKSIIQKYEMPGIETETPSISEPIDTADIPNHLFDKMQFHPRVLEASKSCFIAGNYREAILNALISLIDYVKEITGLDLDGDDLMNKVFSFNYDKDLRRITKYPIIRISELKTVSDRDEQQGFMFLCKGAAVGIRNPKAHKLIPQSNPLHTLEYLAFASLLMRRVEEGTAVKIRPPKAPWSREEFLADALRRCIPERVKSMEELINFTTSNSDSGILWGTGTKYGSFVFQKLVNNVPVSIFQIYTDGTFFLHFSPLRNKGVGIDVLNQFRLNLNRIPSVRISENVMTEKNKYGSLGLNSLRHPDNLKLFQEAVLSLCQQLDNSKE